MYFRQPRYFADFHCVGGTCVNSCCIGWDINWTQTEIDKVKNDPNCSEELRALMESSFHPAPRGIENMCSVTLEDKTKRCPFLTEDNFCKIQRELGAEYLSVVCTTYPRGYIATDNECYRFCNMSCPAVMNKLLNDEKSTDLVNIPIKETVHVSGVIKTTPKELAEHPELKYRGELFELFYEIIADKRHPVETNIVLGALAAQTLSKLVESNAHERIPEAIKQVRAQLHDSANLKSVENIKPNYVLKLAVAGKYLREITRLNIMSALTDETETLNIDRYNRGERRLAETYKDKPWYLRNIALNLLLELGVPLRPVSRSIYENYVVYAMTFALMKLTAVSAGELAAVTNKTSYTSKISAKKEQSEVVYRVVLSDHTDQILTKFAAVIVRSFSHSPQKTDAMLEALKKEKMFSPAYLALFVK